MRPSQIGGYSRRQFVKRGALFVSASALLPRIARAAITGPIASSVDTTLATSLTTTAINSTGGTLIVLIANGSAGQDPSAYTVTDKVGGVATGNIWNHLTSQSNSGTDTTVIWYSYSSSGGALVTGASHTVTFGNGSSLAYSGAVTVWQGTLTGSDPYEGHQNGAHNTGIGTLSSGNITPGSNNCLIISGAAFRSQPIPYTNTLATIDQTATWVVTARTGIGSSHTIQSTAALVSSSWTMTAGNGEIAVTIAAFLPRAASALVKHRVLAQ